MLDPSESELPTVSDLFQAYYDCRRTKRNSDSALFFEERLERNLMDLYYELIDGAYYPGPSNVFVVEYPRVREVWASAFRDRVVHHLLYNKISDRFHRRYIHDSYACIPGKGTHKAVARMEHFSRSITQNFTVPGYVLKMDVANFFVSVNRLIVDAQMTPHIPEQWWLNLARTILHRDPVPDAIIRSSPEKMLKVPRHKSLFNAPPNTGLTIGALNSQFLANVNMNPVDQLAKHRLKLTHYVRYVDDMTAFSTNPHVLADIPAQVDAFMQSELGLRLHPNKTSINKVEHGFDALGYIIRPYSRYLRRSTVRKCFSKIEGMCRAKMDPEKVRQVAHSYFGILSHASSWKEQGRLAMMLYANGYGAAVPKHLRHARFPL